MTEPYEIAVGRERLRLLGPLASDPEAGIEAIETAGKTLATTLAIDRSARIVIEPGDMTRYEVVAVAPSYVEVVAGVGEHFCVGHEILVVWSVGELGTAYPWSGSSCHPSYVQDKWRIRNEWSALVLTHVLNAAAAEIARMKESLREDAH